MTGDRVAASPQLKGLFGHRTPTVAAEPEQSIPQQRPATVSVPALPSPLDRPSTLLVRTPDGTQEASAAGPQGFQDHINDFRSALRLCMNSDPVNAHTATACRSFPTTDPMTTPSPPT
jgi:hypothetical protein